MDKYGGPRSEVEKTVAVRMVIPEQSDDVANESKVKSKVLKSKQRGKRWWCLVVFGTISLVLLVAVIALLVVLLITRWHSGSCVGKLGQYKKAAVSSDAPVCSEIGRSFLARPDAGIADSAIAALICMGVVNVHSMGIGGGLFITFYSRKERKFYTLDARETAPLAAFSNMYETKPRDSQFGAKSIAIPGELAGYKELHQKFGKLPWKELLKPTIELCRNGFTIERGLHISLQHHKEWVKKDKHASKLFVNPLTGELYQKGDIIKMKDFANTLEEIAVNGPDHFYNGSLADRIVREILENGGIITKRDLEQYRPKWRKPVVMNMTVRGQHLSMATLPPPSGGVLMQFIVKTLNGYGPPTGNLERNLVREYHRFMEVSKYAYGIRAILGDEDFVNVSQVMTNLQSDQFMASIRHLVLENGTRPDRWYSNFSAKVNTMGTAHLSIVDRNGNAISATSTINHYFGSKLFGNYTGIIYNNEMDDFSTPGRVNYYGLPPSEANFIVPGKRAMSSMGPVLVANEGGDIQFATGASGGSRIISVVAQILWRSLLHSQDLKTATDAPRIYELWMPPNASYEASVDPALIHCLRALGHDFTKMKPTTLGAIVQSIQRKDGTLYAYADPRKGGCVNGV